MDDAVKTWGKTKSPQDLHKVIGHLQPTIDKAVNNYAPDASPIVKHRAQFITADAVRSFDPSKGASLHTHVYRQLQSLQRVAPTLSDPLVIPERARQDRGKIYNSIRQVEDNLGREASDEEVAELSQLPVNRVTKVRKMLHANIPASALDEVDEDEGDSPDPVANRRSPMDDWQDAVYHDLGDIDRVIMQYRTGYRGYPVLANQEIAKRLKLSPAAISQRVKRIQGRMDEFDG